jgi:hypothetical protein
MQDWLSDDELSLAGNKSWQGDFAGSVFSLEGGRKKVAGGVADPRNPEIQRIHESTNPGTGPPSELSVGLYIP